MSIKIMSDVWEHSQHSGSRLLVLLKLADRANDDGICWPGQTSLAKAARTTRRNTIIILEIVERSGELAIGHRYKPGDAPIKDTNIYVVLTHCDPKEVARRIRLANMTPGLVSPIALPSDAGDTTPSDTGNTTPSEVVGSHESSVSNRHNNPQLAAAPQEEEEVKTLAEVVEAVTNGQASPERESHNAFFEAILEGYYGLKYTPGVEIEDDIKGYVNREAKWWRGQDTAAEVAPPAGATPEKIRLFFRWYGKRYPKQDRVQVHESIVRYWAEWRASVQKHNTPRAPLKPMTEQEHQARLAKIKVFDPRAYEREKNND